jgi:hypothetical protein
MNNSWVVVNQQTTNSIIVSSSYSMVGQINYLANCNYEGVIKALLLLKNIYNLKAKPNDAKANKEEGYDAGKQCIYGNTKHNVWPIPVLSSC